MAIIHDVIPPFQLYQPTTLDDAAELAREHGDEAWITALEALVRDAGRRAVLAERARVRAQLFTAGRMADGFERLIVPTSHEGRLYRPQPG